MMAAPALHSSREPKRSESQPATGATRMITAEPPMMIQAHLAA
jgi:hypothetical protein